MVFCYSVGIEQLIQKLISGWYDARVSDLLGNPCRRKTTRMTRSRTMLILRQLTRRVEELPQPVLEQIETLSLEQLENLGEALLDFQAIPTVVNYAGLETWFSMLE